MNKSIITKSGVRKAFLFLIIQFVFFITAIAQQFPVQGTLAINSPYPAYLSDYANSNIEKLVLNITLTDLNIANKRVRLKLFIQKQNSLIAQSADNIIAEPTIILDGGVPQRLTSIELGNYFKIENLQGINADAYSQALPEGVYNIGFEVYDYFTGNKLSDRITQTFWLMLNDPPLLNMPRNRENILDANPNNPQIVFQWTPRTTQVTNTEYEFTLSELWDDNGDPYQQFLAAIPKYQTTTSNTTLLYGITEPPLLAGRTYAWRVHAKAKAGFEDIGLYHQNGYSEIFIFKYAGQCAAVQGVNIEVKGYDRMYITWQPNPNQNLYKVAYRKYTPGNSWEWHEIETFNPFLNLFDLEANTEYEIKVGGVCNDGLVSYSTVQTAKTLQNGQISGINCGQAPVINLANQTLLQHLSVNEVVMAGDFPITITRVEGGNGTYSGEGWVKVPWLADTKIKVKYTGIKVNTDYKLLDGFFETTYDPTGANIGDIDQLIEDLNGIFTGGTDVGHVITGSDTTKYHVDFDIPDPCTDCGFTPDGHGGGIITFGGGHTLTVTELPTTIKDSKGDIYQVDKDGHVIKIGNAGGTGLITAADKTKIDLDKGRVNFAAATGMVYAFDAWQQDYDKSSAWAKKYEKLNGGNYRVSAKAIAPGKADKVLTKITLLDNTLKADSIKFVNGKGTIYSTKKITDTDYEITMTGGPADDAQEIYALYPQGTGKPLNLGKLLVASYALQKRKLVLVPVNGAPVNKDSIRNALNRIYNKVCVEWEVIEDANFENSTWDLDHDNRLKVDGSGTWSVLTEEMKALNNAYRDKRNIDSKSIYLFVLSQAATKINGVDILGDMPRGKQFGYLFSDNINNNLGTTSAHEVGHGVYKLKHVFDYSIDQGLLDPTNIMDYPGGEVFSKYQWDIVHDPGLVIGIFENDEDVLLLNELGITSDEQTGDQHDLSPNTTCSNFFTKDGYIISVKPALYDKAEIKDGYLIAIIDKQNNRFEYSHSWQPKKIIAELIGGKRVEKEAYALKAITFINWTKVKEEEGKPNSAVKSEDVKAYKQQAVAKFYSGVDAYSIKPEQVQSCSAGLQIVESYDAQGNAVCRSLSETECENFTKTKSIFGAGNAEVVKACNVDAYYQEHELMVEAADGTTTWGEKLVKQLNYLIAQNSKNKFGDNVLAAKLDGVKYIEPGTNYRGDDVLQAKYTLEELNKKMAYLEISTGYQFYTRFIDSWCSFAQTDADKFAKDVFINSNISKEKGIYCMVLHNNRISIDNPAAFTFTFAFGSQVPADVIVIIKNAITATPANILQNYTRSLIQAYKLIPKKKVVYYYNIKTVSQAQIAVWPGSGNCLGSSCPHYGPLTADIRLEITNEENKTGNAIEAHYFIVEANSDNRQYIQNVEYELKEEYVTSTAKDVAILYGEKFANWKLYGWDGKTGGEDGVHITYSTKPRVESCKFTLGKPCSQVLIDNIITVANLVAVPFGWPAIVVVGATSVIYYGATGQWDEAGLYLASYLLPPVAIEIVKGIATVTSTIIKITVKSVAATLSPNLRVALEFREVINRGLSEQAMQTLFAKQINTACAEYIIPNGTYKNLWVKITPQEAMVGSFELENGETKLVIRGYVNGKNYNVSSLTETKIVDIAEETIRASSDLSWIDQFVPSLPANSRMEITAWINKGLDNSKLKIAFETSNDKVNLFAKLSNAKGLNHQRAIINDYLNIPGVTQGEFISNAVDNVSTNIAKSIGGKEFTMYPGQAKTFMKNAVLSQRSVIDVIEDFGNGIQFIKIKPGTKVYRVFDGYKPWDNITMSGNTLPNGSFWVFQKPNIVADVIEGTAVMPEWNGMTKIIEIKVPTEGLYGWFGKAAKQPASSMTTNFYLKGGEEQVIINFGQNQQSISSITTNINFAPWVK